MYILSADRDEHIRISRGPPQTHVIETFCLGHTAFVSCLAIPESRRELLVSGGGDHEIFLWDWLGGNLLDKGNVFERAQEVVPWEINRIAVSGLTTLSCRGGGHGDGDVRVVVMCER